MKRCRKDHAENADLRELDKLVLYEINAMNRRSPRQQTCRQDTHADGRKVEIIKLNEKRQHPRTDPRQHPEIGAMAGEDHALAMGLGEPGEHLEPGENLPPEARNFGPAFDPELSHHQEELLSAEEEEFIENTVGWLHSRDNKDVIVARIWTLLTESAPESFYSPAAEPMPDPEPTPAPPEAAPVSPEE